MSSPHLSFALGEAHRAELRRQAERYHQGQAVVARRAESPIGSRARRALARLSHTLRRPTAPAVAVAAALPAPGERRVRVETAESPC